MRGIVGGSGDGLAWPGLARLAHLAHLAHLGLAAANIIPVALTLQDRCAYKHTQHDHRGAHAPPSHCAKHGPLLDGYGQASMATGSPSAAAQSHFNQGLRQAYAFNEQEAVRMFKAALAADPACALCAWGVAWQLGPNINNTSRDQQTEALRYADLARRNAAPTGELGQALINAMALRYGQDAGRPVPAPMLADVCASIGSTAAHPLDIAYAQRLHSLLQRWPDDADLHSLWAEAELVATRSDWWSVDGKPAGRLGELADRLDAALLRQPAHTGLQPLPGACAGQQPHAAACAGCG